MISLTFSIRKTSGNQRELWLHVRIFGKLVVSRRVFRVHARQHRVIRDVLCALRFWVWRKPAAPSVPQSQKAIPSNHATYISPVSVDGMLVPATPVKQLSEARQAGFAKVTTNSQKPKAKGNFNPVKPKPSMPEISSVYGKRLKAAQSEAGI